MKKTLFCLAFLLSCGSIIPAHGMGYGINEPFLYDVSQANIIAKLDLMKSVSVQWLRLVADWDDIESGAAGSYYYEGNNTRQNIYYDTVITEAGKRGIKVLVCFMYYGAGNVGVPRCPNAWGTTENNRWKGFVQDFVERYDGDANYGSNNHPVLSNATKASISSFPVTAYEIWNEQNLDESWCGDTVGATVAQDAQGYVNLLSNTYMTIKNCYVAGSTVTVVSGGLNGLPWKYKSYLMQLDYMDYVQADGMMQYCDVYGIHPYRNRGPYESSNTLIYSGSLAMDMNLLRTYYSPDKPVWITELGWNTGTTGVHLVDQTTQAEYLADMFTVCSALNYLDEVFWYSFNDHSAAAVPEWFGITDDNNAPKPSWNAYRYATGLTSTPPVSRVLAISVSSLDFGTVKNNNSKSLTFGITNSGTGTLTGTVSSDSDWISVSPAYFHIASTSTQTVTVSVDKTGLANNTYGGNVTVTTMGGGGSATLPVNMVATCVITRPNPYNPRAGSLTFFGTGVPNSTIKIYTLSGELVKKIDTAGAQEAQWDGKNESGDAVQSGIYLYTSESPLEKNACSFTVVNK